MSLSYEIYEGTLSDKYLPNKVVRKAKTAINHQRARCNNKNHYSIAKSKWVKIINKNDMQVVALASSIKQAAFYTGTSVATISRHVNGHNTNQIKRQNYIFEAHNVR